MNKKSKKIYMDEAFDRIKRNNEISSASPAGYVAVPIAELEKLEQARLAIYEHLQGHIGGHMLQNLTAQIWRVANTKKWD